MSHSIRRLLALAVVFAVAFLAVFIIRNGTDGVLRLFGKAPGPANGFRPEQFTLPEKAPLELSDVELLARLDGEYAKLTEAVTPSVVSIDTAGVRSERRLDIFGRQSYRAVPTQGQGSGVIVSHEGHVVTNNHVVAGQQQIQVRLHDGRVFPATLIGTDDMLDVAVLKIEGNKGADFQPLKFGDSTQVRRGQIVFAIGNPFGLGETITQGIISAVERSLSDTQRDLFQTDAAINPGNSGGPLVNLQGEIIGINSAIYSPDRANPGFQGVGFSIPSNDVKDTLYAILERGRPIRGYFGVRMLDMDPRVREILGYNGDGGAVVIAVGPDSPAQKAGLQERDVILSYDGQAIRSTNQLIVLVQRTKVGRKVPLKIWRGGQEQTLEAEITESSPETPMVPMPGQGKTRERDEVLTAIGVNVRDLTVGERQHGYSGVVVSAVQPGGAATDRLQPGDLVVAVNQNRVGNAQEFYQHLASSAAVQATTVHFIRAGEVMRTDLPALPRQSDNH